VRRSDDITRLIVRDFTVIAVPVWEAQRLILAHNATAGPHERLEGGDFDAISELDVGDPTLAQPGGEFVHMSGIQYYFGTDFASLPGHTAYSDSEWGLSSISQPQFWIRRRGWWDGYRGVLSVDICTWHVPSSLTRRTAWDSDRDEIAAEVWRQIKATMTEEELRRLPHPRFYHLDDNLQLNTPKEHSACDGHPPNCTPFMITRVGAYPSRPGRLNAKRRRDGYEVRLKVVFAGAHMQTFTRMTTMEAANESARHAVNGILEADEYFHGGRCDIQNPEDNELPNLSRLVEIDRDLHARGLPHLIDILGWSELPSGILEAEPDVGNAVLSALKLQRLRTT
jgi:hypothetical protein